MPQNQIGFLFLAAGASTRMRGSDKLLKEIDGVPLMQKILDEALSLNFPVFATIPANNTKRKLIMSKTNANIIEVHDADLGMGNSIAKGVIGITKNLNICGIAICPSDLPGLRLNSLQKLTNYFFKKPKMICCPVKLGKSEFGHPVIFPQKYFEQLKLIKGDMGAKFILQKNKKDINRFETEDDSYFIDLDTPEDFNKWNKQNNSSKRLNRKEKSR